MPRVVAGPGQVPGDRDRRRCRGAMAAAAARLGWEAVALPLSDGGEGLLEACAVVCPEEVATVVTGPDGSPVTARWRLGDRTAVVESARASGLAARRRGGGQRPGGGDLPGDRRAAGGGRGPGGAGRDRGGRPRRLGHDRRWPRGPRGRASRPGDWRACALVGACDVATRFVDAAPVFGPAEGGGSRPGGGAGDPARGAGRPLPGAVRGGRARAGRVRGGRRPRRRTGRAGCRAPLRVRAGARPGGPRSAPSTGPTGW